MSIFGKNSAFSQEAEQMRGFFDSWHQSCLENFTEPVHPPPQAVEKTASGDALYYLNEARWAIEDHRYDDALRHIEMAEQSL